MSQELLKPPPVPRCPKCGFASGAGDSCEACGANLPAVRPHLVSGPSLAGVPPIKREATGGWLAPVVLIFVSIAVVLGGLWYYFAPQIPALRGQTVVTDSVRPAPAPVAEQKTAPAQAAPKAASVRKPKPAGSPATRPKAKPVSAEPEPVVEPAPKAPAASPSPSASLPPSPSSSPEPGEADEAAKAQALVSAVGQLFRSSSQETEAPHRTVKNETSAETEAEPVPPAAWTPAPSRATPRPSPHAPAPRVRGGDAPIVLSEGSFSTGRAPAAGGGSGAPRGGSSFNDVRRSIAAWGGGVLVAPTPFAKAETAPSASSAPAAGTDVVDLNEQSFGGTVNQSSWPVVVDFWAPWCGPCRKFHPVLEQAARNSGGRIRFARVNVDENKALARRYGVESIPTVIVFKSGAARHRTEGAMDGPSFKMWLDATTK